MKIKWKPVDEEGKKMREHLEIAGKEMATWPAWKRGESEASYDEPRDVKDETLEKD